MLSSQTNLPNNNPSATIQQIKIRISEPLKCSTTKQLLKYQWTIFITLSILLLSTLDSSYSNSRIVLYCILFILLQTFRNTNKCLEIQDPLQLSPLRKFYKQISVLIQINMTYLLFRILMEYHNIYSFLLFLHYSVIGMMNYQKNKKNYQVSSQNHNSIWKVLTPLLLFIFATIIHRNISEVSLVQLILLSFNLLLTIQIKMLLINKECHIFGWEKHGFEGKNHLIFNKYQAVKKIMFAICAAVAVQNLLFILPTMNQYASFTMFHSLVLGAFTFYIYRKSSKK